MKTLPERRAAHTDVNLLLEGTFPFVRGGVSSWVNEMIKAFPEIRFGIVFIGSQRSDYGPPAYPLPDNVVHIETHYLYEHHNADDAPMMAVQGDKAAFERASAFHDAIRDPRGSADVGSLIAEMIPMLGEDGGLSQSQFLTSRRAWDSIVERYERFCTDPSFTDYFWTVRTMHRPLWQLAEVARNLPSCQVLHTISTGYAGFLGAIAHYRTGRPLLISEHGIYTKERKIDLLQSQWIRDNRGLFERDISRVSYFRELWVRFFEAIGKLAYNAATDIVALYETNRLRQIADGAPEERTRSIPNGIDVESLAPLVDKRSGGPRRVVALIGRVVPIKDIKTFIRGIFIASRQMPEIEGWIIGPEEEDKEYARECRALVESLGLQSRLKFLGFQRIDDVMPQIDLIALTSISEALPLVLLEGFAAGVPAVTTDVGSCRQLIEGADAEDRALGASGAVVQIADPAMFAQATVSLLSDEARWVSAQVAGLARVRRYYTKKQMVDSYRSLYQRLAATPDSAQSMEKGSGSGKGGSAVSGRASPESQATGGTGGTGVVGTKARAKAVVQQAFGGPSSSQVAGDDANPPAARCPLGFSSATIPSASAGSPVSANAASDAASNMSGKDRGDAVHAADASSLQRFRARLQASLGMLPGGTR